MGRPPIGIKEFKVQLEPKAVEQVDALVGAYRRSAFIREAVRQELARQEEMSAFDRIAAGLADATADAGGDATKGRDATINVKAVRARTKKTQPAFASAYHFPIDTVRDWELGLRQPDASSITLLKMIQADPEGVERIIAKIV